MVPKINTTPITISGGIHRGAVTHHQDQSIVSVSFKMRNTINRIAPNPIPPPAFVVLFDILLNYWFAPMTGFEPA